MPPHMLELKKLKPHSLHQQQNWAKRLATTSAAFSRCLRVPCFSSAQRRGPSRSQCSLSYRFAASLAPRNPPSRGSLRGRAGGRVCRWAVGVHTGGWAEAQADAQALGRSSARWQARVWALAGMCACNIMHRATCGIFPTLQARHRPKQVLGGARPSLLWKTKMRHARTHNVLPEHHSHAVHAERRTPPRNARTRAHRRGCAGRAWRLSAAGADACLPNGAAGWTWCGMAARWGGGMRRRDSAAWCGVAWHIPIHTSVHISTYVSILKSIHISIYTCLHTRQVGLADLVMLRTA